MPAYHRPGRVISSVYVHDPLKNVLKVLKRAAVRDCASEEDPRVTVRAEAAGSTTAQLGGREWANTTTAKRIGNRAPCLGVWSLFLGDPALGRLYSP